MQGAPATPGPRAGKGAAAAAKAVVSKIRKVNSSASAGPSLEGSGQSQCQGLVPAKPANKRESVILCQPLSIGKGPYMPGHVEELLDKELKVRQLHGQPFTLSVTATPRKLKVAFALHCNSCHRLSCKLTGRAFVEDKLLYSTEISGEVHGQPGPNKAACMPKQRAGRKIAAQTAAYPCSERLAYHGTPSQKAFHEFVTDHFEKAADIDDSLRVTCHTRKPVKRGLTCVFRCGTHCSGLGNAEKPCKWAVTQSCCAAQTPGPVSNHVMYTCGTKLLMPTRPRSDRTLTWRERQLAKRNAAKPCAEVIDKFVEMQQERDAAAPEPSPRQLACLSSFLGRCRCVQKLRQRAPKEADSKPRASTYKLSDFEYPESRCNASLGGSSQMAANDLTHVARLAVRGPRVPRPPPKSAILTTAALEFKGVHGRHIQVAF